MLILFLLAALPFLLGFLTEYAACRLPKHRAWRWLPPALCGCVTGLVFAVRYYGWTADGSRVAPWEQLLIVPGVPALLVFSGIFAGWRLWKYRWQPRVVRNK